MTDINFALQLAGPCSVEFTPISPRQCLREGDQGVRVIVQIVDGDSQPLNIRPATSKLIKLMRPDGTSQDIPGVLFSNGADGKMYFVSSAVLPPFNQVGEWFVQAKVVIGGVTQSTNTASFLVESNID